MAEIKNLEICVLQEADQSDPLNQIVVVGAKAIINGTPWGWKGTAVYADFPDYRNRLNAAIGALLYSVMHDGGAALNAGVVTKIRPCTALSDGTFKVDF